VAKPSFDEYDEDYFFKETKSKAFSLIESTGILF
jgi:hypothetical protein